MNTTKQAMFGIGEHPDLLRTALLSVLAGSSGYAGMRLGKDMMRESTPYEPPTNELQITLPQNRLPKKMASEKAAVDTVWGDYVGPALALGGGTAGGFLGASKIYDIIKRKQMESQMQNVQGNYMQALQKAHNKMGSVKTPLVDKLCEGIIAKIGSIVKEGNGDFHPPSMGELAGAGWDRFTNSDPVVAYKGVGAISALLSAAATYGIAKRMDAQRDAAKSQSTLPTDVKLNIA